VSIGPLVLCRVHIAAQKGTDSEKDRSRVSTGMLRAAGSLQGIATQKGTEQKRTVL
jgi:hypothetical protein